MASTTSGTSGTSGTYYARTLGRRRGSADVDVDVSRSHDQGASQRPARETDLPSDQTIALGLGRRQTEQGPHARVPPCPANSQRHTSRRSVRHPPDLERFGTLFPTQPSHLTTSASRSCISHPASKLILNSHSLPPQSAVMVFLISETKARGLAFGAGPETSFISLKLKNWLVGTCRVRVRVRGVPNARLSLFAQEKTSNNDS